MTGILLGVSFLAGMLFGAPGVIAVGALAVVGVLMRGRTGLALSGLIVLLALLGSLRASPQETAPSAFLPEMPAIGVVTSLPAMNRVGQQFTLSVNSAGSEMPVSLCVSSRNQAFVRQGETVKVDGDIVPLNELPADRQAALQAQGCDAILETENVVVVERADGFQAVVNRLRSDIASQFRRIAPGDTGALMTGLVIGDDSALTYESRQAFLDTGTTHITAVSGANFAILVTLAAMIAGTAGARRRWGWIAGVATAIWLYALLVGLPPSAVRAALMATLALLSWRLGRIPDFLTLLVITIVVQLTVRPSDLHTLSFQLSVAATLALILVFSGWTRRGRRWWPLAVLVTSATAHLATIPVLAWHLGEVPAMSIPANSAISPLVLIAFPTAALSAATGFVSTGLGSVIALPATYLCTAVVSIVTWFQSIGAATTQTGAMPASILILLTIACWGFIALLSFDCRVLASQLFTDLRTILRERRSR